MIFDQITLHNFGVYAEKQKIELTPPSFKKPIVLFEGLNGTGKTTLMDALQLCLFGPAARCVTCNGSTYKNFLASRIRKNSQDKFSSVSVSFRHTTGGIESSYKVSRTWRTGSNSVREKLDVSCNKHSGKSLAENWDQQIDEVMPANISHLFFFDGEGIASYASQYNVNELIARGVCNLFGIDLIERLQKDLHVLERRQVRTTSAMDIEPIDQKEENLQLFQQQIEQLEKKKTALLTKELNTARNALNRVTQEFKKLGGELLDRRKEIQCRVSKAEAAFNACNAQMEELASGELPLLLIRDLLHEITKLAAHEQKVALARTMIENLQRRDRRMFRQIQSFSSASDTFKALQAFCQADIEKHEELATCEISLNISDENRSRISTFLKSRLPGLEKEVRQILAKRCDSEDELKSAQFQQAGIPAEDSIEEIVRERDLLNTKILQLEAEIANIDAELEKVRRKSVQLESEIDTLWEQNAKSELMNKDTVRFIQHSQLARQTLEEFGLEVLKKQIGQVESLALESYQALLRKDKLVSTLQIHPESFVVLLRDMKQAPISPKQLSAGERQLLVVALMWGMAKASGKSLPIAIDMPMGRLDSTHRERLVERYFPYASHQTLLFTTDEEVAGEYLSKLRPWVGKSYYLDYDDMTGSTTVSKGYVENI